MPGLLRTRRRTSASRTAIAATRVSFGSAIPSGIAASKGVNEGRCSELIETCSQELGACAVSCAGGETRPDDEPIRDTVIGFCVECRVDDDPRVFDCGGHPCARVPGRPSCCLARPENVLEPGCAAHCLFAPRAYDKLIGTRSSSCSIRSS